MDSETEKTEWEEILFETTYPSWILLFVVIIYAVALLIVIIT